MFVLALLWLMARSLLWVVFVVVSLPFVTAARMADVLDGIVPGPSNSAVWDTTEAAFRSHGGR